QVFSKGNKNNWTLDKILSELQIPKQQKQLILDKNITNREEIITSLLADNSFTVEVNVVKSGMRKHLNIQNITEEEFNSINIEEQIDDIDPTGYTAYKEQDGWRYTKYVELDPYDRSEDISYSKFKWGTSGNSEYYSNLTVPGGTNYTEYEIATPA